MAAMLYLNALEFLDEERDVWRPFEALDGLTDEQLLRPVTAAHDWSGQDLMGHLVGWLENALTIARELAVSESSRTKAKSDADWDARGGEVINAEVQARYAALPLDELRDKYRTVPGELRGTLTVVPESRWIKHSDNLKFLMEETIDHYAEHESDLQAILAAAGTT
jgi:hypothetical protein